MFPDLIFFDIFLVKFAVYSNATHDYTGIFSFTFFFQKKNVNLCMCKCMRAFDFYIEFFGCLCVCESYSRNLT